MFDTALNLINRYTECLRHVAAKFVENILKFLGY